MEGMASSTTARRTRKQPDERRAEILEAAADIALERGLERITLRALAERLGVRPGLITHYFPAVEDVVVQGFERAAVVERERFFPRDLHGIHGVRHFVAHVESGLSEPLARLWLNARHLSRFTPALEAALREQDRLDRERLLELLAEGMAAGDIPASDAHVAAARIWIAVDGSGSYVNVTELPSPATHKAFVADVAEWSLGLPTGSLPRPPGATGA